MPYIKKEDRLKFNAAVEYLGIQAKTAGELNYIITRMLHVYLKENGIKYANINEVIGVLECCKLELYRAVAAPYEGEKFQENGQVGVIKEFGHLAPDNDIPGQLKIDF